MFRVIFCMNEAILAISMPYDSLLAYAAVPTSDLRLTITATVPTVLVSCKERRGSISLLFRLTFPALFFSNVALLVVAFAKGILDAIVMSALLIVGNALLTIKSHLLRRVYFTDVSFTDESSVEESPEFDQGFRSQLCLITRGLT